MPIAGAVVGDRPSDKSRKEPTDRQKLHFAPRTHRASRNARPFAASRIHRDVNYILIHFKSPLSRIFIYFISFFFFRKQRDGIFLKRHMERLMKRWMRIVESEKKREKCYRNDYTVIVFTAWSFSGQILQEKKTQTSELQNCQPRLCERGNGDRTASRSEISERRINAIMRCDVSIKLVINGTPRIKGRAREWRR